MNRKKLSNKILYQAILIAVIAVNASAQPLGSITGTVVDEANREPLSNANILVTGSPYGAASDLNGEFTIDNIPVGTYSLTVSYLGYEAKNISEVIVTSARPSIISVALKRQDIAGEEVTVRTGYFWKELDSPPSVSSLTSEEIRRFPGGFEDVIRAVSALPGIAVVNSQGRNDLLVRGGGPSENLYVINGMEVPNINHFGTQGFSSGSLSFVNLDFVDNVDFSAGGFGAESGDKMSSVMELKMRPARPDRFGGKATISATQFGIDGDGPLGENGGVIFSARKSYLDLIFKAAGLPFVPVYTDYNLIANYDITPRDKLFFIGLAAIDRIDRTLETLEDRVTNAANLDNSQDQIVTGVSYRRIRPSGYSDVSFNLNSNSYRFSQIDENEEEYFRSNALEQEAVLKLNTKFIYDDKTDLYAGITSKLAWIDNQTEFADSIYDRSGNKLALADAGLPQQLSVDMSGVKYAGFLKAERQLNLRTRLTVGIRGDYYSFIKEKLYPALRAALDYKLSARTVLKMSAGTYYQAPSYVWVSNPVNKSLKALRNDMGVFGADYTIRQDIAFSGEVYYKNYSNLPTGATPETSYLVLSNAGAGYGGREDDFQSFGYLPLVSEGKGNAYGLELTLTKKYSQSCCYGQAALSIGRSEYTAANRVTYPGIYDQRVIFTVSGGVKPNPKWEYSGRFRFYTGAPYTPVYLPSENGGDIVNLPDEYLQERLKPGHHLDVRVDRRFNLERTTIILFLDIQNIYNYKIPRRPNYDFWADEVNTYDSIGILPSIGFSAEF